MHIADKIIRDAIEAGEFDNLPGQGRPVDLDEYFATPEDARLTYSILKNAGYVPEEVELLKQVAALERQLAAATDETTRAPLRARLADTQLALRLKLERRRR